MVQAESISRTREQTSSLERANFINAQAARIRLFLEKVHLSHLEVSSVPEARDADFFKRRRTLAFSALDDIPLVLAASSKNEKTTPAKPVSLLVVSPKSETESGLIVNQRTRELYTDSFWICEDGKFSYIVPSRPVKIDGVNSMYDGARDDEAVQRPNKTILALSDDKHTSKEIMATAGLPVPKGVFIENHDQIENLLSDLRIATPHREWLVLKELHGSHGDHVEIFRKDSNALQERIAELLSSTHKPVMVEERIMPPPLSSLIESDDPLLSDPAIDYNFRILVTMDPKKPRAIDGEIRYKIQSRNPTPVNITHDSEPAEALPIDAIKNSKLIQTLYKQAELATKALCEAGGYVPGKDFAYTGVDIMLDSDLTSYILEINTGAVGGFATLARIRGKTIDSVGDVLIPEWHPRLKKNRRRSWMHLEPKFKRLDLSELDYQTIYSSYMDAENYKAAESFVLSIVGKVPDTQVARELYHITFKTSEYDTAKQFINEALARDSENSSLTEMQKEIEFLIRYPVFKVELKERLDRLTAKLNRSSR